jgi:hypothetical protein
MEKALDDILRKFPEHNTSIVDLYCIDDLYSTPQFKIS